jgi:hypothetical protein
LYNVTPPTLAKNCCDDIHRIELDAPESFMACYWHQLAADPAALVLTDEQLDL